MAVYPLRDQTFADFRSPSIAVLLTEHTEAVLHFD